MPGSGEVDTGKDQACKLSQPSSAVAAGPKALCTHAVLSVWTNCIENES